MKKCSKCGWDNYDDKTICAGCGQSLVKKKNKWLLPTLIGVAMVAVVVLIASLSVYFVNNSSGNKYVKQIDVAENFFAEKDYEGAVEAYLKAIELDETNEDGYVGLAKSYGRLYDYKNACEILQSGIEATGSERLESLYESYKQLLDENADGQDINKSNDNMAYDINGELFNRLLNYTYEDYKKVYGGVEVENKTSKLSKIEFSNFKGEICYENNNDIATFNTSTGIPYSDMKAKILSVDDLSDLIINFNDYMDFEVVKTLFGSNTEIQSDDDRNYIYAEYSKCSVKIECDKDGNIKDENAWNEIEVLEYNIDSKTGTVMGNVIDAQNGNVLKNVAISFRKGTNVKSGNVVESVNTDSQGAYEVEIEEGTYTIEAKADGYVEEYFVVEVEAGNTYVDNDFALVSQLGEGSIRIVLSWGAIPSDLDSHLFGTTSDGQNMHIFFENKTFMSGGREYANLDLDDTSSYGPETITLNDMAGSYTYSIVDYSNEGDVTSQELANSNAVVKVYLPGQAPIEFRVPQGAGFEWDVFKIENGNITQINTIK